MTSNTHQQQPINCKKLPYSDDYEPSAKRIKVDQPRILLSDHQIAIVIPVMASRFQKFVATYDRWRTNGFVMVLVFKNSEEQEICSILPNHVPDEVNPFILHPYITKMSNVGIAKGAAYDFIHRNYLNDPNIKFALLLDDTVDDMVSTCTEIPQSIMTSPTEFYNTMIKFAAESPVIGGAVGYNRHPDKCIQCGIAQIERAFLQQALVFSCRGTSTLTKHFENADDYIAKMRRLSYRKVPFGEDVSFQVALYENGVLSKKKSPQFWGLGISRMSHISATKKSFDKLDYRARKALKYMMIYLHKQKALRFDTCTNELVEVRVLPGRRIRIPITGKEGERPWREAYKYAFLSHKKKK